ncbi:cytochrome P450 [Haladaptatus sp. GCM10025707]|uniref:cytochrome P450 n=1 Tax=unclassified Haladaptatus TaxID=2622732 RepID=UPI0023E7CBEE|nr:cytochrome P450 [Haladaptatus sp. QDMS2]
MSLVENRDARPPGPTGLPVVGNSLQFGRDPLSYMTHAARAYGDVVYLEFAGMPFYQLNHPDLVKYVLVENNQNYRKGDLFQYELRLLGQGLLNSEGAAWREQRHRLEPAFHPQRIAAFAEMMTGYTERFLEEWADEEVRDVHEDMMRLTLEIVADALFSVDIRRESTEIGEALETVMEQFRRSSRLPLEVPDWLPTRTNLEFHRAAKALDAVVANIIRERNAGTREGADDVVSRLLDAGVPEENLRDEVLTLVLAGHETTALALSYTFDLLTRHPPVLAEVQAELDSLAGHPPTMADVKAMTRTDQVLKESMRLYPPVYGLLREPLTDDEIGGYHIPVGATVGMHQWVIHRDPRFFSDPRSFRPDRWTPAFERELPAFAYFPFGGGPRRCIGDRFAMLEAKFVLGTILQQFDVEAVSTKPLELDPAITLRPKGGIRVRVTRR